MLAHSQGNLWNASSYGNSLGITSPTVNRYINFLENTYLIRKLSPFFTNAKKRIIKSPKVYIRDSGIVHYLLGLYNLENLMQHPIIGHSWEGYVIEQIISVTNSLYEYYYYRTQSGTECDLIIARGGVPRMSIEVKFSSSPKKTKSFTQSIIDLGTTRNYIVIPKCPEAYPLNDKIIVCDLGTFLSDYLPLLDKKIS